MPRFGDKKPFWEQIEDPEEALQALIAARDNPKMVKQYGKRRLANAEHKAFSRYAVNLNPLMAIPLLGSIPGYDMAKRFGLMTDENTTAPGIDQMAAGYNGMWQGLGEMFK